MTPECPAPGWRRRLAVGVASVLASVVLLTACGSESPAPAEQVPGLADRLAQVDRAIVAGRYPVARAQLEELIDSTLAARGRGRLDPAQADRVLAAAAALLSALPQPSPEPPPAEPRDAWQSEQDQDEDEDEDEKRQEEREKKLEEERKKHQEEQRRDDDGEEED
jgi:hypothetical protein